MVTKKKEKLGWLNFGGHNLPLPQQHTEFSAGYDLCNKSDVTFTPSVTRAVPTGWCVRIPEGYVGIIRMRSGVARRHQLTMANSGIIDSDYRGEIIVDVNQHPRAVPINFESGSRLFQMVIVPCLHLESEELSCWEDEDHTDRGAGGFGSTGK